MTAEVIDLDGKRIKQEPPLSDPIKAVADIFQEILFQHGKYFPRKVSEDVAQVMLLKLGEAGYKVAAIEPDDCA